MIIFLDLDEVVTDFTGSALAVHDWTKEELEEKRVGGEWNILKPLNLSPEEFWKPINELGVSFWEGLRILPWGKGVVELVKYYATEVHIVTSPAPFPAHPRYSRLGKIRWFYDYLEEASLPLDHLHLTPRKELFATYPGAVLIDDSPNNVEKFRSAGGKGILFPSEGNELHSLTHRRLRYLTEELEKLRCILPTVT